MVRKHVFHGKTHIYHGKPPIFSWFHRFTGPETRQVLRGAANTAGGSMEDFLRQAGGKIPPWSDDWPWKSPL